MIYFSWNAEKNEQLKKDRNVSFEEIIVQIEEGKLLDILEHPNQLKYQDQKIFVVELNSYVYLIPYIENEEFIFLKTIIPSRKATKKYLKR
jgi:uncharacterized DUF497 family protein